MKWFRWSELFELLALLLMVGCARPMPNDAPANAEAADKIRLTLVSNTASGGAGAATETEAAPKASGWGSIKGRFVFDGPVSTPANLTITKDQDVCGKHPLPNEALLVSSDGGLANVVLFPRNKNIEVNPDYAASADKPVLLDNHDCHFEPHIIAVRTGQPLDIKNSDSVSHNTNIAFASNAPFNAIIPSGSPPAVQKLSSAEASPATAVCNIHPWMKGYVVVQSHPYVAISSKDGTFELKNLPAGIPLEFQAWHESSTGSNGAVQTSRPDLKWQPNGRFTVTLQPDQTLDLQDIKVPAASLAAK
jgi:plastocyanin